MIQQDHAVGDVLFQTVASKPALATLGSDDGRDTLVFQPTEQPPQFRAEDALVRQAGEERLDGVQHHALRASRVNGVSQADEQAFQIVLAGLLELASFDPHVIQGELLLSDQLGEVEAEGQDVLREFRRGFLEGHEDARLVVLGGPAYQKLHCEEGLSAAGTAADQRGTPFGQSALSDLVKPLNSTGSLRQAPLGGHTLGSCYGH